jgi:prepilin-type N-terminal cleavage/methylation domain-containing protein
MKKSAFSLIELLVVVSVLGILTALLLPNLVGMRLRARDAAKKQDLGQLKTALRMYYNDFQNYPASSGSGQIMGCGSGTTACPNSDGSFSAGSNMYMKTMPDTEGMSYAQQAAGDSFLLSVALENVSDPEAAQSANKCNVANPQSSYYYVCAD